MEKIETLKLVVAQMRNELELLNRAAEDARSGATDDEVKSESKYDTRGLEASYLARGHAMKFEALAADVATLESLDLPELTSRDAVVIAALVDVKMNGFSNLFFVLPCGGGIEVTPEGSDEVTVITPESPLGSQLMGKRVGDTIALPGGGRKGEIKKVQ